MAKYSVIIPVYNRINFIKDSVSSVLNQTFRDFELIVVDDGSQDGTGKYLKGIQSPFLKYIYQKNSGVSAARNVGLKESKGEYVAFLDSDDRWLLNKLEISDQTIRDNPDYKVFHTQEKWYLNGKFLNHKKYHGKPNGDVFKNCLKLCSISISTAVIQRDLIDEIGYFDESFQVCEDYDFWLRVSAVYKVYLIDKILTVKEGGHDDQLSRKYWGMDRFRIRSIQKLMETGLLDSEQMKCANAELKKKCSIYRNGCLKRDKIDEAVKYEKVARMYSEKTNGV